MFNVAIHTDAYCSFVEAPFEVHSNILFRIPVNLKWVFVANACNQEANIFVASVFNAKVIDNQRGQNVPYFSM